MRSSNKSRSRNKNHNRRPNTNVVNRVFDSSGPEGKVRGTPQQIVDKYQSMARDAQLNDDRVAAENFLQHSEHYSRLLVEALREATVRREQHEAQQAQNNQHNQRRDQQNQPPSDDSVSNAHNEAQPDFAPSVAPAAPESTDTGLVDTPENGGVTKAPKPRAKSADKAEKPAKPRKKAEPAAEPVAEPTVEPAAEITGDTEQSAAE